MVLMLHHLSHMDPRPDGRLRTLAEEQRSVQFAEPVTEADEQPRGKFCGTMKILPAWLLAA